MMQRLRTRPHGAQLLAWLRICGIMLGGFALVAVSSVSAPAAPKTITSLAGLHALTNLQASKSIPVVLEAIVTNHVKGSASAIFDGKRQLTGAILKVPAFSDIKMLQEAPVSASALPFTPMNEIPEYSSSKTSPSGFEWGAQSRIMFRERSRCFRAAPKVSGSRPKVKSRSISAIWQSRSVTPPCARSPYPDFRRS